MEEENNNQWWTQWWIGALIIAIVWIAYSYFSKKEVWTAHYMMTTDNRVYSSQEFSTSQECADWMSRERAKEAISPNGRYNFECGSNCKLSGGIDGLYICDKTFDN